MTRCGRLFGGCKCVVVGGGLHVHECLCGREVVPVHRWTPGCWCGFEEMHEVHEEMLYR